MFFSQHTAFSFHEGDVVVRSGERPADIYFLRTGIIKQATVTQKGQELCVNLYKPGSFFPLMDGIADIPNQYTFIACTDSTGWKAPVGQVKKWLQSNPDVSYDLSIRLLKGLHGLLQKNTSLMQGNARATVVQTLLMLAERFPAPAGSIDLHMTHQKLAEMCGLTRETVTREISVLRQAGLLAIHEHSIVLLDPHSLSELPIL